MTLMHSPAAALNRDQIRPGDRICAAVSGGADSVALLLLLHEENAFPRNGLGAGLSAVHVHHGLRGEEADADQAFVEDLCAKLAVPLHLHRANVPECVARSREQGRRGQTIEEAARSVRYGFFASLLEDGYADSVLTAHTLDDQAETVLTKLLRGAWTEGLSGIHPVVPVEDLALWGGGSSPNPSPRSALRSGRSTGKIVRPLLSVRRANLREFLESRRQSWREDSTNSDESFTRNRIRHTVLPVLRQENPSIDKTLANMATLAREDEARWQSELARIVPQIVLPGKPVRGGGRAVSASAAGEACVAVEVDRLRGLEPAVRRRVVRAAARGLGARLSFEQTARLLALCGLGPNEGNAPEHAQTSRTGATLQLSAGLRAERSLRELRLYRNLTQGGRGSTPPSENSIISPHK